jgi:hypothetical protein
MPGKISTSLIVVLIAASMASSALAQVEQAEEEEDTVADAHRSLADERFHVGAGLGTGVGIATGDPIVYGDDVKLEKGLAAAPPQIYAEFGYSPIEHLHVVLSGQFQMVFLDSGFELVPRGRLSVRYNLVDRLPWRIGLQVGGGYGYQVHFVRLNEEVTRSDGTTETIKDVDRTEEGPGHLGGGAQFSYMFNEQLGIFADVFVMGLFPQASAHLDLNIGLYVGF